MAVSGWRAKAIKRSALAVAGLAFGTAAHADWVIAAGSMSDMAGGAVTLGCTDLYVAGTLVVGAGGSLTSVRSVFIEPGGSLQLDGGRLELMTMRRYTPGDSTLSGLMLTPSVLDESGAPMDAHYVLSATSGVFMKWDALLGTYVSVGATAESDGETVVWSAQTPAENAKNPVLTITVTNGREPLGEAALTLTVDGEGYRVDDYALN